MPYTGVQALLQVFFGSNFLTKCIFATDDGNRHWPTFRGLEGLKANLGCYVSLATYPDDDSAERNTAHALGSQVLIIDDVGTRDPIKQHDPGAVMLALGEPTARVRTSPGNEQWWYRLSQFIPKNEWPKFVGGIERELGKPLDDGGWVAQFFRLPMGVNLKEEYQQPCFVELLEIVVERVLDTSTIERVEKAKRKVAASEAGWAWDICGLMRMLPNDTRYNAWMDRGFQIWAAAIDKDKARVAWLEWSEKWSGAGNKYAAEDKWDYQIACKGADATHGYLLLTDAAKADPAGYAEWQLRESAAREVGVARAATARVEFDDGEVAEVPLAERVKTAPNVLASGEFVAGFVAPDYLVDKLITKSFLYSLTGQTGAGKTSITLRLAATLALGRSFGGLDTEPCRVLYLAAENPVDIQMRWIALADEMGFDLDKIPVFFVQDRFGIGATFGKLRAEAERVGGDFGLVVVDTGPVFFEGEDENNRVEMRKHAEMMRKLIKVVPGKPAVIVNVHPTKNAGADNLLPAGGGSFLNEVDGNLTAAKSENQSIELGWQGKWRGVEFAPLHFILKSVTHPRIVDSKGRSIPTVVCDHQSMDAREVMEQEEYVNQGKLLTEMERNPRASITDLATHMEWFYANGKPDRSKVQRYVKTLKKEKLVKKHLQSWVVGVASKTKLNGKAVHTVSSDTIHPDTPNTKAY